MFPPAWPPVQLHLSLGVHIKMQIPGLHANSAETTFLVNASKWCSCQNSLKIMAVSFSGSGPWMGEICILELTLMTNGVGNVSSRERGGNKLC